MAMECGTTALILLAAWGYSPATHAAWTTELNPDGSVTITGDCSAVVDGALNIPISLDGHPVTGIGNWAFSLCPTLNALNLPDGLVGIGDGAFSACTNLWAVILPASLLGMGSRAFQGCTGLTNFTVDPLNPVYASVDGVVFNRSRTSLVKYPPGRAGDYVVPEGVRRVEREAFAVLPGLTGVTLPNTLTSIEPGAFQVCLQLARVDLGKGVTSIGVSAFQHCIGLTNLVIPNSVQRIERNAFGSCSSLTNLVVGGGIQEMGDYAFSHGERLTTAFFAPGARIIGWHAFYLCSELSTVVLPATLTTIGWQAFFECRSLTSIHLPSRVTRIEPGAFEGCSNLASAYFDGGAPNQGPGIGDVVFFDPTTIYYFPGTAGWGPTFSRRPTTPRVLPYPVILELGIDSVRPDPVFGFLISWATNQAVIVESRTDLTEANWTAIATNALVNGSWRFIDPEWTQHPTRFYRVRW